MVKKTRAMQEIWVQSLGQENLLQEEMATHSSILAWEIPWTEECDGLQSMGSQSQTRFALKFKKNYHFFFIVINWIFSLYLNDYNGT